MLFRSLCNASVPLRTAGLFDEAESALLEALSVAKKHKTELAGPPAIHQLASLAFERGRTDEAHRWYRLLKHSQPRMHAKHQLMEIGAVGARLALLDGRPAVARRLAPANIDEISKQPLVFQRTYQAALHVAIGLANGLTPSADALRVLEDSHLQSRRSCHQAFAAYALYVGLRVAGRQRHGKRLLTEYLDTYRREPWPAPKHLLATLEKYLAV